MPVIPFVQHQSGAPAAGYHPGSREDFDRLYQTAYPRVYRTLAAILADPAEAEDCAQDAFVQAFQAWARWQPTAPAEAWIHRIAAAIVLRHYHGYNNREIAAALGVSERTVGTRLKQAGERLRAVLEPGFSLGSSSAFPSDSRESYADD